MKKEYIVELREEEADELMDEHWVSEFVRCKDCKWYRAGIDIDGKPFTRCKGDARVYGHTKPDWFCADGERL